MTYEERRTTVVRDQADSEPPPRDYVDQRRTRLDGPVGYADSRAGFAEDRLVDERRVTAVRPSGSTVAARIVALIFGLIQLIIGLRIVFLLLNAREANALVAFILDLSRPLVAPFEGIFQTNALQAGGSVLDIAAIVALIGWTVVELIILALMRVPRPGEDV